MIFLSQFTTSEEGSEGFSEQRGWWKGGRPVKYNFCSAFLSSSVGLKGKADRTLNPFPKPFFTFRFYYKRVHFLRNWLTFWLDALGRRLLSVSPNYCKGGYFEGALRPTPKQQAWLALTFRVLASSCLNFCICWFHGCCFLIIFF